MIKSYTAFTNEIDDAELAVSEILAQLELPGKLLKSSVGILSCYTEFVDLLVVKAICEALPFDVVGMTTIANAAPDEYGETMLNLLVLTSDDVEFVTGVTEKIDSEDEEIIRRGYEAIARPGEKPSLMFSFVPLLLNVGGDFYINAFDKVSGGVPNFGSFAIEHGNTIEEHEKFKTVYNGIADSDRCSFVLAYGETTPKFYVGTISDDKIFSEKGAVTTSSGNILETVDGMPMLDYLLSVGLSPSDVGSIPVASTFPIIVDSNDGMPPIVRVMLALMPEGHIVCGGEIPNGATISIGEFDPVEICKTTKRTIETALSENAEGTFIMFSCVGRYFVQGLNQTAEMKCVKEAMEGTNHPYFFAYSGGELCPISSPDGEFSNRNHNNTFIICVL